MAGGDVSYFASGEHKDEAMETMAKGLAVVVRRLYDEGKLGGIIGMGGTGRHVHRHHGDARPARGRAQGDGVDGGRRRCQRLRRDQGHHLHPVHRRRGWHKQHQPRHFRQRGGGDCRHGQAGPAAARRGASPGHRFHVREHDDVRRASPRGSRERRLRSAGLSRHRHRRQDHGEPDRRRLHRRPPWTSRPPR